MSDAARAAILGRLRAARAAAEATEGTDHAPVGRFAPVPAADFSVLERKRFPPGERYALLKAGMRAVQAEFVETTEDAWPDAVRDLVVSEKLANLAYGPATPEGRRLEEAWRGSGAPPLLPYDRAIELWKRELFEDVAAGFTTTRGGIAETGGLVLWPSPEEPRLLSLVPPVHIALLDAARIFDTFFDAMRAGRWSDGLPANALLVSGPSKTADIEQTLAYGVHGPKRLIVVAVRPGGAAFLGPEG